MLVYLIFLLIMGGLNIGLAETDFEVHFENFTCTSDDTQLKIMQCFHCRLNNNARRRTMNLEFQLREPLYSHKFHITIELLRRTGSFVLLNYTTDGCSMLSNSKQVTLIETTRKLLDRYSNYPTECPFQKAKIYYIRGFRMDLSLIPAANMEVPVRIMFAFQQKGMNILAGHLKARMQLRKTGNNKRKPKN